MAQASDFVSMRPRYRVSDWDSTLPLMQSFTESAALDPTDLLFQDWSSTDDSIFGRSLFRNVDALLRSLDRSSNLMNMMSAGPAPMSALEFHGSADDLAKIQAALPKIQGAPDVQIDFYDSGTGYKTASADRIGMEEVDRSKVCSTYPYFEVSDWSTAEPIMQEILQKTSNEAGCIHFAWTRSGNRLRWHGYYTTGDALKAHVEAIRPLMDQLMAGPAKVDRIEVYGPKDEISKAQNQLQGITADSVRYFPSEERVRRLTDFTPSPFMSVPQLL